MSECLRRARRFLDFLGFPAEDPRPGDAPARTFGDGSQVGLEVPGINDPHELRGLLDECDRLGLPPPQRVIETHGLETLGPKQVSEMQRICLDRGVGLIVSVGPRATRGLGSFARTPHGGRLACRLRGMDHLAHGLADVLRGLELGLRGFLVYDEGLLEVLSTLRASEEIPAEVKLKASIALGCANPVHARQLEGLGADSINPVNDLSTGMLSAFRSVLQTPLDVHVDDAADAGGIDRTWEIPELVAAAAPVFLKCGSSARPPNAAGRAQRLARVLETLQSECPEVRLLKPGAPEVALPAPA